MKAHARYRTAAALVSLTAICCLAAQAQAADGLNLIPTPKSVKVADGEMLLGPQGRVVAGEASLKPLAEILCREILALTKVRLTPAEGEPRPGDIVLKINPALRADDEILAVQKREVVRTRDYAHTVTVDEQAVVEGWDYRAVCEGTATILQALRDNGGKWSLPKLTVKDWPHADYTGVMMDCARQDIPIVALKDAVDACRFWKVRYLHLHFAEDGSFVFPLKDFPDAGKFNGSVYGGDIPQVWDRAELIKLVAYADARGVTLVPELEGPGHCSALQSAVGGKLGDPGWRMLDVANDAIYPLLDGVITDICEVFKSSPFFHIGGDEIQFDWYIDHPHVREYIKKNNLRDHDKGGRDDLLKIYVTRLNESVKKNGKKAIFWGGLQGPPLIPALNDCIVYSWYAG
ncbi:MAG: family 20 glycosylhydrolase, partial [Planctomycetota bacterium]